ncbi:MAG: hypothetical protein SVS85_00040 [Candidatus Nanohaloarchaea archaeon]|nr:hypothetical protein [Candidatus Nanohaloarchaea archaeon]
MNLEREVVSLVEEMDRDVDAVVVEGKRDREAIEEAGFSGRIYTCSQNTDGIASVAREVREEDSVAILTDFDEEGGDLCGELRDRIPDSKLRKHWRKELGKLLTEKGRRDIESINNLVG